MKKIGLTQRVQHIESYGETRDALDQQWSALLVELGYAPILLPNNLDIPLNFYSDELGLSGFILTGGNDLSHLPKGGNKSKKRDSFESSLLNHCEQNEIPVLGVCRGMQMINHHFGGKLSEIQNHVAAKHELSSAKDAGIFADFNSRAVNSFHNFGIQKSDLAAELIPALICKEDDSIEAFYHSKLKIFGAMWHPERESPFLDSDKELIKAIFQ